MHCFVLWLDIDIRKLTHLLSAELSFRFHFPYGKIMAILIVSSLLTNCEDPYEPSVKRGDRRPVVEGRNNSLPPGYDRCTGSQPDL